MFLLLYLFILYSKTAPDNILWVINNHFLIRKAFKPACSKCPRLLNLNEDRHLLSSEEILIWRGVDFSGSIPDQKREHEILPGGRGVATWITSCFCAPVVRNSQPATR